MPDLEPVSFLSGGSRCEGWLYRPESESPAPCVVMAHGLGGARGATLPSVAEQFAAAGLTVLLFDYRYWGTSEGSPRGMIDIAAQRGDYRAAVAHARGLPGVDPSQVVVWGTSFSGGHALTVAADDPEIAAVVIQNPYVDGRAASVRTRHTLGAARVWELVWLAVRDRVGSLIGRPPRRVPLVGDPGELALITAPGAAQAFRSVVPPDMDGCESAVPARLVLDLARDRPGRLAGQIRCPLLLCLCARDRVAPRGAARAVARAAPRAELREYPIDHFDLFHDPWRTQIVADQIAFLQAELA